MKEKGEPGDRLPLLCIFPEVIGRVYFTIHFTVRGGGGGHPQNHLGWDPTKGSLSVQTGTIFWVPILEVVPPGERLHWSHLARVWDPSDPHAECDLGNRYIHPNPHPGGE